MAGGRLAVLKDPDFSVVRMRVISLWQMHMRLLREPGMTGPCPSGWGVWGAFWRYRCLRPLPVPVPVAVPPCLVGP